MKKSLNDHHFSHSYCSKTPYFSHVCYTINFHLLVTDYFAKTFFAIFLSGNSGSVGVKGPCHLPNNFVLAFLLFYKFLKSLFSMSIKCQIKNDVIFGIFANLQLHFFFPKWQEIKRASFFRPFFCMSKIVSLIFQYFTTLHAFLIYGSPNSIFIERLRDHAKR